METTSKLYPNVYCFLVGAPGVGKTRAIRAAKAYLQEISDFHFAPTSMTAAAMVDSLTDAKRVIIKPNQDPLEYNSMMITAEELTAFMHKYDDEMIGALSAFYDTDPYLHYRRGKEIKIKIKSPQLTLLTATTPSNLLKFLPEFSWDQGFTSRCIMVYSTEKIIGDDFAKTAGGLDKDLIHDLKVINSLHGQFKFSDEWKILVNNWRQAGEPPVPNHPKLLHYATRRRVHLYKLGMLSCIDRGDNLVLDANCFNQGLAWLIEVEGLMPDIFSASGGSPDAQVMEEIVFLVRAAGRISEHKIIRYAAERLPLHAATRVVEIMVKSGMITAVAYDERTGNRMFVVNPGAKS